MKRKSSPLKVGSKITVKPFEGWPATEAVIMDILEHDDGSRTYEVIPDDDPENLIEVDEAGNVLL